MLPPPKVEPDSQQSSFSFALAEPTTYACRWVFPIMADRLLHGGTFQSSKSSIYGLPKQLLIMKMYASQIALVATSLLQHCGLVQKKVTTKANPKLVSIFVFTPVGAPHFCGYHAR